MLTTSSNSNTSPWASHSSYPIHPLNIPPNDYPQLPLLASLRLGSNLDITSNNSFSPPQTSGLDSDHLVTFSATPDLEFWPCCVLDSLTSLWPHEHFPHPVLGSISPCEHQVPFWLTPHEWLSRFGLNPCFCSAITNDKFHPLKSHHFFLSLPPEDFQTPLWPPGNFLGYSWSWILALSCFGLTNLPLALWTFSPSHFGPDVPLQNLCTQLA